MARSKKALIILILSLSFVFLLTGCLPGDGTHSADKVAGFFTGIWHGWIAPISLIGSLFNKSLRIYEPYNTGFFYDFGFYMAIISGFGGLSLLRKKNKTPYPDQ